MNIGRVYEMCLCLAQYVYSWTVKWGNPSWINATFIMSAFSESPFFTIVNGPFQEILTTSIKVKLDWSVFLLNFYSEDRLPLRLRWTKLCLHYTISRLIYVSKYMVCTRVWSCRYNVCLWEEMDDIQSLSDWRREIQALTYDTIIMILRINTVT